MKYIKILVVFFFVSGFLHAQDSTKVKLLNHELGVNVISLVKQLASNSPSNTLSQLPYDFFYNLYYRDLAGLRVGGGVSVLNTKTEIEGQQLPRISNSVTYNLRFGGSWNFVRYKKVTLNCFADYIIGKSSVETSNTSTTQLFPNPVESITTETLDETKISGFQAGAGIKYNFYQHLSLYLEIPYSITSEKTHSNVKITETGEVTESSSFVHSYRTRIYLPTTVYLVLRF